MKYNILITLIEVHCEAVDWADHYEFKGTYNWISHIENPEGGYNGGWKWVFDNKLDATMFKLKFG